MIIWSLHFAHPGRVQGSLRSKKLKRRRRLSKPKQSLKKKLKVNLHPREGRKGMARRRMPKKVTTGTCRETVQLSVKKILRCWNQDQTFPRITGLHPCHQWQSSFSLSFWTRCRFWDWRKGPSRKSAPLGSDLGKMPATLWKRRTRLTWSSSWTRLPRRNKPNLSVLWVSESE